MTSFTIVELSEITGVKVHVLQYWEALDSLVQPRKDLNGKKFYSQKDLQIFLRLRFLVHEKKFTVEGAYQQIKLETSGIVEQNMDELQKQIKEVRDDLTEIYYLVRKYGKNKEEQQ